MKNYKSCWHLWGGCLFVVAILANGARAYTGYDNLLPSPTYHSTNQVSYQTPGGQYTID